MRKAILVAAVASVLGTQAFAGDIELSLLGTASGLTTRGIMVGPPGGLVTDTVVDINLTAGVSDSVMLPAAGGTVDVFFLAGIASGDPSAGLASFVFDFASDVAGPTFGTASFDVSFLDVPGRMTGGGMAIPADRRIAGHPSDTLFHQSYSSPFGAAGGAGGASLTDVGAGGSALTTSGDSHTFGIGLVGNNQMPGPTALGHFEITVPADDDGIADVYTISPSSQVALTYVGSPMFTDPPAPGSVVELADVVGTSSLSITVAPEPGTLLLVFPAAALLRRRRR